MLSFAEIDASFPALSAQYRRLVDELLQKVQPTGQPLSLAEGMNAIAGGLNPNRTYRIEQGTLTVAYDNRHLFLLEEGDLVLPDAGLQASSESAVLDYVPNGSVRLATFDTIELMRAVLEHRDAGRTWTKLLLVQHAMMIRCVAALTDREARHSPGFQYVQPGETIIRQGDQAEYVYSLFEGEADVLVDDVPVGHIGEGEIIGAIAVLTGQPRSATVRAKTRCALVKVPRDQFATLIRANPNMIHSLLCDMARHIVDLNRQVVSLSGR